jgi:thiol-disulfide isomerase/thioredoxin
MADEGASEQSRRPSAGRTACAAGLSVVSFFLLFVLGEGVSIPATVPGATYVKVAILVGGYLGFFFVCQYLLSFGHAQAVRRDWPLVLALNWTVLLMVPFVVAGEDLRKGLAMLGAACATVASSYAGAYLAGRSAARRRGPPRDASAPLGLFLLFLALVPAGMLGLACAPGSAPRAGPSIYDEGADGAGQIADALARARMEHKHVLLQFGANWCGWCHRLHELCQADAAIAGKLKAEYVVVMIDVNRGHNRDVDARYGNPTRLGLPALVVLDTEGRQLVTQNTGELEEGDHHNPAKVMAFLERWAPKRVPG